MTGHVSGVVETTHARRADGEKTAARYKIRRGRKILRRRDVMTKVTVTKREPTHAQTANRAFEIYVSRGGEHGHDVGDWYEAERQLRTELQPNKRAVTQTSTVRVKRT